MRWCTSWTPGIRAAVSGCVLVSTLTLVQTWLTEALYLATYGTDLHDNIKDLHLFSHCYVKLISQIHYQYSETYSLSHMSATLYHLMLATSITGSSLVDSLWKGALVILFFVDFVATIELNCVGWNEELWQTKADFNFMCACVCVNVFEYRAQQLLLVKIQKLMCRGGKEESENHRNMKVRLFSTSINL